MALFQGSNPISSQINIAQYADVTNLMKHMTIEVGDIGQVMLPLNENENKRRYLNGQAILQEQFPIFTQKLKNAVALYPNLACTEGEWQDYRNADPDDQCAKFVIDDISGLIRLPRIKFMCGNLDLYKIASGIPNRRLVKVIKNNGNWANLYNDGWCEQGGVVNRGMATTFNYTVNLEIPYKDTNYNIMATPAFKNDDKLGESGHNIENVTPQSFTYYFYTGASTDGTSTFFWKTEGYAVQHNNLQYETITGQFESPYYIQVSTGVEYQVDVVNQLTTNSPYSLGMYTRSIGNLNNASWLKSEGKYYYSTAYPDLYQWILQNYNGTRNDGIEVCIKNQNYKWHQNSNTDFKVWTTKRNPKVGDPVYGYLEKHVAGYITEVVNNNSIIFFNSRIQDSVTLVYESTDTNNFSLTDYMYVIDSANNSFRLPLLVGDEMVPDWANTINPGFPTIRSDSKFRYIAPTNGFIYVGANRGNTAGGTPSMYINGIQIYQRPAWNADAVNANATVKKGDIIHFHCDADNVYGIAYQQFVPAINVSPLYFYCGETLQDANLINVGRIIENIADIDSLANIGQQVTALAPVLDDALNQLDIVCSGNYFAPDYARGTGVGIPFTAPSDGWIYLTVDGYDWEHPAYVNNKQVGVSCGYSGGYSVRNGVMVMLSKNDVVSGYISTAIFYPMKGVNA